MESTKSNRVSLVTGAASGIGQSTALAFAHRGDKVIVSDIQKADATMNLISKSGGEAHFIHCDISQETEVKELMDEILRTYGRLDYAVNNAGTEGIRSRLENLSTEEWDHTLNINLRGTWLCMKYELLGMMKQEKACIVNISSIAGLIGFTDAAAYVASKHGVLGLTKAAALENARTGIRINAVCPGFIKTPMIDRATGGDAAAEAAFAQVVPMGRMGKPSEISDMILYLCSDSSTLVTGACLVADGGWTVQ